MKILTLTRFITFFFLLFGCGARLYAAEPDSIGQLKSRLGSATGKERMKVLKSLTIFYYDTLPEEALGYATQYLKLAENIQSDQDIARAHGLMAGILKFQVNYRASLHHNKLSIKYYKLSGDSLNLARKYYAASDNYIFLRAFDSAVMCKDSGYSYFRNTGNTKYIFTASILLGKTLSMSDENIEAVRVLDTTLQIALKTKRNDNIGWVQYWLGFTHMKLGNFKQAGHYLSLSIANYDTAKSISGKIGSQQALGELYMKTGEFANAYDLFFKAYQNHGYVKGERGGLNYTSQYYVNMGEIHFIIGDLDQARNYYDTAATIAQKMSLEPKIALTNKLKGRVCFWQQHYPDAYAYYLKALDYYEEHNNKYELADLLNKIGGVYEYQSHFDKAIESYNQSLTINLEIGNKFGAAQNHINLASCYLKTHKLDALKKQLDTGITFAKKIGVDHILLRYFKYYVDYAEMSGFHDKAHQYFDRFIPLSEKNNLKTKQNLSRLLVDMFNNELEKEKQLHKQALLLKNLQSEQKNLRIKQLILLIALILMIMVITVYFLFHRIGITRKLEQQVNERTKALVDNEKKLIEVGQTKDRLYSIIAHDLKSPFNSLIGFSNLLHDEYEDFSDEERMEFITIVRNSSEEIFALLENLLDWTRKSSANLKFKPIRLDIQRIVKQTIQLQEKNANLKNITIENNIPKNCFVFADENMLRTVLRNLTSNAIKFTNSEGKIIFDAAVKDGEIECSVTDNGVGMSPKTIEHLFDMSAKIKKKGTANEKGTGLGLLLCKDFIERNGGTLTVDSEENQGSKFTFMLPAK